MTVTVWTMFWSETTIFQTYSCRRRAAPSDDGDGCTGNICKSIVLIGTMNCFCLESCGHIANGLNADIYEIVPEDPYTDADLNYNDNNSRTTIEMNDPNARPAISGSVENMEQYDIIFVGYPIWWGEAPRIVSTFMESYDFSGKTIVPFCTSGGSGMGSSAANLEQLTTGAQWLSGERLSGSDSQDEVMEWVNGLGLNFEE